MDADWEKLCLGEIDHLVLDSDKKVTLTYISNTWNVPNKDSEAALEKWTKKNAGSKNLVREYLIRGVDQNGNSIVTIVAEKNLSKVEKICSTHTKTLYSVEIGSENGKTLNIPEVTEKKYISLKNNSEKRNVKVSKITIPEPAKPTKKDPEPPKKASNIFTASSSKSSAQPKKESPKVKEEVVSPKKASPKKNQAAAKQQGKSSIASFFGSKPTSTASKADKTISETASKIEKVKIKDVPMDSVETKQSQKRPLSNTSDSNEDSKSSEKKKAEPTKKKIKLESKQNRSRIMQLCDSSSDEEDTSKSEAMETEAEPVVKKEKENKTPSPQKVEDKNSGSSGKRRVKVKRTVTKTYEDEDGFINTVHETEEVSCSEEEPEPAPKPKKPTPVQSNGSSTAATKKKVSPPAGKKQGSILSFFGKK